jgi:hypothetical protein
MGDDGGPEPRGEPAGNLPAGAGMTGPFGQSPDKWQRSPTPAGIAGLVALVVIVVLVVMLIVR